ncbi:hypothetical protein FQB35_08220 [Crassaminicella thermophila]|uniref:Uncharacterized protein n=1 Tax=Crassaminicella thermophila TaxID=2599308 RepID=A0A5C0SE11_CRATE|nr:hypothetical protein [Crassaminicella thermophila]QEK12360.1 hypothetical protein FQB35_08220 [Crassaminicella thermophila]
MDIMEDILPILILIITLIGKIKNFNKKDEVKKPKKEKRIEKDFSHVNELKKTKYISDEKNENMVLEEKNTNQNEICKSKIEINKEYKKEIKREKIKSETEYVIKDSKRIKKNVLLNERNLFNGIIMSEVLGKPKSLRR